LFFVGCFVLLLCGCAALTGEDWTNARSTDADVILEYNLQGYVPVPTTNGTPVVSLQRGDLTVSVVWKDAEGQPEPESFTAFKQDVVYQAEITLTANGKRDYAFDSEISFYYPPNSVAVPPEPTELDPFERHVTVTYFPTQAAEIVDKLDLTFPVKAPLADRMGASYVAEPKFAGLVLWDPPDRQFVEGEVYTATTMLYPAPGYAFAPTVDIIHTQAKKAGVVTSSRNMSVTATESAARAVIVAPSAENNILLVRIEFNKTTKMEVNPNPNPPNPPPSDPPPIDVGMEDGGSGGEQPAGGGSGNSGSGDNGGSGGNGGGGPSLIIEPDTGGSGGEQPAGSN
jgi:uncharacterized membrane protein YgcG